MRYIMTCFLLAGWTVFVSSALASDSPKPTQEEAPKGQLVGKLMTQLGVTEEQAAGGAGSIFRFVKGQVDEKQFSQIGEAVPNVAELIQAAPAQEGLGGLIGGLGGGLGGSLGGGSKLGALAALAGPFKKLGLDEGMVMQFLPIVIAYVQEKGGDLVANLMSKTTGE